MGEQRDILVGSSLVQAMIDGGSMPGQALGSGFWVLGSAGGAPKPASARRGEGDMDASARLTASHQSPPRPTPGEPDDAPSWHPPPMQDMLESRSMSFPGLAITPEASHRATNACACPGSCREMDGERRPRRVGAGEGPRGSDPIPDRTHVILGLRHAWLMHRLQDASSKNEAVTRHDQWSRAVTGRVATAHRADVTCCSPTYIYSPSPQGPNRAVSRMQTEP